VQEEYLYSAEATYSRTYVKRLSNSEFTPVLYMHELLME